MALPHSIALITLLKGIIYDSQKEVWQNLLDHEADIKKYFTSIGLDVYLDRSEGFAFLKQKEFEPGFELPRLIERRPLSFPLTLLCLILRKYLLENDAAGTSTRAFLSKQQIVDRIKLYLPDAPDEAKQVEQIEKQIKRIVEEGFLRPLENEQDIYEVKRIIKEFINAETVENLLIRLKEHAFNQEQK